MAKNTRLKKLIYLSRAGIVTCAGCGIKENADALFLGESKLKQNSDFTKTPFFLGKIDAELPYFDEEKLNEINRAFPNDVDIVATHTVPSFAYPTTKQGIGTWLKVDDGLEQVIDRERATMDLVFAKLQERQKNIVDWYYGQFHEHKLERHYDINFRLCDCGEINEFRERRMDYE